MEGDFKNTRLLVIAHSYKAFQKIQIELLAPLFKEITVLVRYKPIAELYRVFNFPGLKNHSKNNAIDLYNLPENVKVLTTALNYLPLKRFYRNLGKKHFSAVDKQIERNNIKFDVVLAHFLWTSGYVANEIAKKYNKPAFIIVHENAKRLEEHLQFSDTQKWKIAGAFSVNRKNIGILKNTFKSVSYLPNTYNDSLFVPLNKIEVRNQLGLPKDKQIILNVANYTIKDKNQLNLIDAFHRYHEKNKNTMLYLIGNDAGDKGKIRDHIENLNLESVIVIVGSIRNNVLPIWMNTADIFILPSNNESFGIVQVEALACGIPVVATRNGGSEEILNEEIGVLSEGKDAESLCKAIEKANLIKWDKEKIAQSSDSFKRKRYSAIFIDKIKFILNEEVSI